MKKLDEVARREARLKRVYYMEEVLMLLATTVAVLFAEAYKQMLKRGFADWRSLHINVPTVVIASIVSIITYGSMASNFKFNDMKKPPLIKRLANSFLYGFAWQSLISSGKNSV